MECVINGVSFEGCNSNKNVIFVDSYKEVFFDILSLELNEQTIIAELIENTKTGPYVNIKKVILNGKAYQDIKFLVIKEKADTRIHLNETKLNESAAGINYIQPKLTPAIRVNTPVVAPNSKPVDVSARQEIERIKEQALSNIRVEKEKLLLLKEEINSANISIDGKVEEYRSELLKSFYDIADSNKNILEKKIDIAIDLNGFTEFNQSNCFSKRLAPIQISYLGYPGSTGIKNLDYIIADEYLITDEVNKFYSEKILNLPECYRPHYISKHHENKNKITKEFFLLNENKLIFGCFNNPSKINENIFNVWMKILKKIPNSVLWLIEYNLEFKNNLLTSASKKNIDPSRLVFRKKLPIEEHLKTYKLMDIFLDTFPYNGHTTLCESLYEGTPVITLSGKSFASRVGASILYNLNMKEMITHNLLEYEEKIIEIASSPDTLKNIKINLKNNIDKGHIFNPKIYVKNLEKVYCKLMQRENFLDT